MTRFTHLCVALNNNNNVIFFGDSDNQFDPNAMDIMETKHVHTFIINIDNSTNNKTNNNGSNSKLDALYNRHKAFWN